MGIGEEKFLYNNKVFVIIKFLFIIIKFFNSFVYNSIPNVALYKISIKNYTYYIF